VGPAVMSAQLVCFTNCELNNLTSSKLPVAC
jgi:hypothetical protein